MSRQITKQDVLAIANRLKALRFAETAVIAKRVEKVALDDGTWERWNCLSDPRSQLAFYGELTPMLMDLLESICKQGKYHTSNGYEWHDMCCEFLERLQELDAKVKTVTKNKWRSPGL